MKEFEVLLDYSLDNVGVYLILNFIQAQDKFKEVVKFNFTWVSKKQELSIIENIQNKDVLVCVNLDEGNLSKLKENNSISYIEDSCFTSGIYAKFKGFIPDIPEALNKFLLEIEAYCTWDIKNPHFVRGMFLSEYYWKLMIGYGDVATLGKLMITNNYDMDLDLNDNFIPKVKNEFKEYLDSIPTRIHRKDKTTLAFINKFQYMFGAIEMLKGNDVIIIMDSGEVQVRTQTKSLRGFAVESAVFVSDTFVRYSIDSDLDSRIQESARITEYLKNLK